MIPGIAGYIKEFTSEKAWGEEGYLIDKGLIPMPDEEREQFRKDGENLKNLIMHFKETNRSNLKLIVRDYAFSGTEP